MKTKEIIMESYSAYILDDNSRKKLVERFPPKYSKFIGHHITIQFGGKPELPPDASIKVVGYVDSGDGLEALVVSVDGSSKRADGSIYHITWSLEPDIYKPVDSNKLLARKRYTLIKGIPVNTIAKIL